MGALYAYGDTDYFWFTGRNNRTLAIDVTTLDEKEQTSSKTFDQDVIPAPALQVRQGEIPVLIGKGTDRIPCSALIHGNRRARYRGRRGRS